MPVLLAFLLDILFGEPPNRFHPTVWMGSLIALLTRRHPRNRPAAELLFGALVVLLGIGVFAGAGYLLAILFHKLPAPLEWLFTAVVLKTTFSLRGLDRAAGEVQSALGDGDLPEARRLLSWHLVSRETSQLDASKVSAASIESVAENTSDGILAPLFFYALGGLPLALAYRFANTADSMLGYHDPQHEWLGKIPARLDDLLNLIPARLTGLLIFLAAFLGGAEGRQAWRIMWRDARLTASPNAGFPMSAMAGALGVELEKIGHYTLGMGLRAPETADLARARRVFRVAVGLVGLLFAFWSFYVSAG